MIVQPAAFERGRTVWRPQPEPGDRALPRDTVWIEGYVRPIDPTLEAIWLALTLQPFAAQRIVAPGAVAPTVIDELRAMTGLAIEPAVDAGGLGERQTGHSAILVRDRFDALLAAISGRTAHTTVLCRHDANDTGFCAPTLSLTTNAGSIRRSVRPLDDLGELAALVVVSPMLALSGLTAFHCRDELGEMTGPMLEQLLAKANLGLTLPHGGETRATLTDFAVAIGMPDRLVFEGLFARYRMHPATLREIGPDVARRLAESMSDQPDFKVGSYLAGLSHSSRLERDTDGPKFTGAACTG